MQAGNALTDRLGVAAAAQHVPAFTQEKFNTALSALVHTTASITLALEMEKYNVKVLRENVATAMTDLNPISTSLETTIEAAEEHLGTFQHSAVDANSA